MRALIQKVSEASVHVNGAVKGSIGKGLLIFLGVRDDDTEDKARSLAEKCVNLRVFEDEAGKVNHSVLEVGGEVLVVSQFTLYGDTRKGRRPSFIRAAAPDVSEPLYETFVGFVREYGVRVATGQFRTYMAVHLVNDGPVTVMAEK
ncbi:MAG: D-tyrosyl-tRNA(Tyr) deacylase [Candidatus Pacebacteria bacterium]|nr:D-tyrosyl-tRNA(Tyr) deacylase [Candidatus Paceibacterota bacterium]